MVRAMLDLRRMSIPRRWILAKSLTCDFIGATVVSAAARFIASGMGSPFSSSIWVASAVTALVAIGLLAAGGVYSVQASYLSLREAVAISLVVVVVGGISAALGEVIPNLPPVDEPLLLATLTAIAIAYYLGGSRVALRQIERHRAGIAAHRRRVGARPPRTLIVGAGGAAQMVTREMARMPRPSHHFVAIVDDDPTKSCTRLNGVPVLGTTEDIQDLVARLSVDEILIAIPSAEGDLMRSLVAKCQECGRPTHTLPAVADVIRGVNVSNQIRRVEVVDLLRRNPVEGDLQRAQSLVQGKVVLITGGGGSIGGELARQIAKMGPSLLVLVGKGENSLFEIEQSLLRERLCPVVALVGDVRDEQRIDQVLSSYRPELVFHAAAHKHVPLMESSPIEAVRNNVFGTVVLLDACLRYEVKQFTYVSTDKAVHPQNVMGATKRIAEIAVHSRCQGTALQTSIVRFGNVLGSRGSLIPALEAQIRAGGPVRVTHPEMTRFFMTIPEAVHLILEATAMGGHSETFILEMGEPVRILDIAHDVIRLHGHVPEVSMPILFTGPRPGEKIHEELTYDYEQLRKTAHPKVRALDANHVHPWTWVDRQLGRLMDLCEQGDETGVRKLLFHLAKTVPGQEHDHALVMLENDPKAEGQALKTSG